jgi:hypothetical protein
LDYQEIVNKVEQYFILVLLIKDILMPKQCFRFKLDFPVSAKKYRNLIRIAAGYGLLLTDTGKDSSILLAETCTVEG